jgi:hypothetical protein
VDGPTTYARHGELLDGLGRRSLRLVALDSVEVALGVIETLGFRPGLGAELLDELWSTADKRWATSFGSRLGQVAELVRDYVPDEDEFVERDDRPELLALAAGVVTTAADDDEPLAERINEATGILIDLHQHVDAVVRGDVLPPGPREPFHPSQMPPPTPEEGFCLVRQIELFTLLSGRGSPPLDEARVLTRQGREHLTGVLTGLLDTGRL